MLLVMNFQNLLTQKKSLRNFSSCDVLQQLLAKQSFAGNDDLRPVMSGVFFSSPEGLTFVATDAHKLVKYARTDVKASQVADFIMPKKPLTILKYSYYFRC
jgi:DNA polymerase-3 subunit beta